jgi:hypothetical protein
LKARLLERPLSPVPPRSPETYLGKFLFELKPPAWSILSLLFELKFLFEELGVFLSLSSIGSLAMVRDEPIFSLALPAIGGRFFRRSFAGDFLTVLLLLLLMLLLLLL